MYVFGIPLLLMNPIELVNVLFENGSARLFAASGAGHVDVESQVKIALVGKRRSTSVVQPSSRLSRTRAAVGIHYRNGVDEPVIAVPVAR